jgi:hypothetical protein
LREHHVAERLSVASSVKARALAITENLAGEMPSANLELSIVASLRDPALQKSVFGGYRL